MNEQKDKLLINLVEPGRIGRTAPTTAKTISQFSLRMGIVNCLALLSWMRHQGKQQLNGNEIADCLPRRVEWMWVVWLIGSFGGLWPACRQWLRRKKRTSTNKQPFIQFNKAIQRE